MKIIKRVRDLYEECLPRYQRLGDEVRKLLRARAEEKGWFYTGRLKAVESFALKIETGRVPEPGKLEDFFACTVVVPTLGQIEEAEQLITTFYRLVERRPKSDSETHKQSSNFAFDDLRLFVARKPSASGREQDLDGMVFEVQIKTILQHAWSVATHDLIYKTDTVSWPRERIAFQVKAMLEHAEVAIAQAERLADAPAVAKMDERTKGVLNVIEDIEAIWSREKRPTDVKRLAETVLQVLRICDLGAENLRGLIEAEKRRVGLLPADLSPYAFMVQALANDPALELQRKLARGNVRTRLVIHDGMDLPAWMREANPKILNLN